MSSNPKKAYAFILLIVSPVLSLVYALRNLNDKSKLLFLTLFGTIYGSTINYLEGNDAWTHVQAMKRYSDITLNRFFNQLVDIITFSPSPDSSSDLYIHLLHGISSVFQSPILLFTIVGTVYGYFYGSALLKVIKISKGHRITVLAFLMLFIFVTFRSYDNMQTIRSWTGMWVLFNGVVGYYQTKNKRYILLMLFSPFFHLMYFFICIPALLLFFFKTLPRKLIIAIYLISFGMNVNTLLVIDIASGNELAESKLGSYYRITPDGEEIDTVGERKKESNAVWYAKYGKAVATNIGGHFFIILFVLVGYYRKEVMTQVEYGLFSVGVLTAALSNFLSFSSTFHNRTMNVATVYILAVLVFMVLRGHFTLKSASRWKYVEVWIGVLIFVPRIIYFSSDVMYRTSMLIFGFPFLRFFGEDFNFSIRDFFNVFLQ